MAKIHRSALVSYTDTQMFELVNAIEDYPRFLPWCHSATIHRQDDEHIEASIDINWNGIHKTFTTRNQLTPHQQIEMKLINGPFKHLEGYWRFVKLGEGCKVELTLEFELAGGFFDKMFQSIFHSIANSLVDAFCKRAVEIYGLPNEN